MADQQRCNAQTHVPLMPCFRYCNPVSRKAPLNIASERFRQRLVTQVKDFFTDVGEGEGPTPASDDALFERDSPIRMVHADVVAMMIGGIRGLLLQMLHPHALQGVLDYSDFRNDAHGRLRRTARFIAVTTFAHRDEAEAAIARVNDIHERVNGTLPDGTPYSAQDPMTLAWVHVAEASSFLAAYRRYVRPDMPLAEQDEYYRQFAVVARKLRADPVPETRMEAETLFQDLRSDLAVSPETHEIAKFVLTQRAKSAPPGAQQLLGAAAIDLLPPFARQMLDLRYPGVALLPARIAALAAGKTLRWAFRQN